MQFRWQLFAVAVAAALIGAPAVDAQIENPNKSTPSTLYFHIFDTFNKFVINTQPMNTEFFEVGGTNFPSLVNTPANDATESDYDFNTIYGTSTAGPVEYDFIENGRPRFHPERGIAANINIDSSVEPVVYLYVDVRDVLGTDSAPNILPEFTFRVTMREGDDPGKDADLDAGNLIMEGQQTAYLCDTHIDGGNDVCAGFPTTGAPVYVPDAEGIIEFAIPMSLSSPVIPKSEAFNVRIDWFQSDPAGAFCGDDQCAEGYLRLVSNPTHLPRLEMNIMNPVYIEFIHPQVAAGTLLIHTGVNSPWGTYDVDVDNITIQIDGPSQPQLLQQVVAQNAHVHGLHDKAAEVTYLWKFRDEGASNGDYTISMNVGNVAGTATASGSAGFAIEGKKAFGISDEGEIVEASDVTGSSEDSPGVGLVAALGVLGLLGAVVRRRN